MKMNEFSGGICPLVPASFSLSSEIGVGSGESNKSFNDFLYFFVFSIIETREKKKEKLRRVNYAWRGHFSGNFVFQNK